MEIKDRIIDKAEELFLQYGIKNISMDELASSTGVSKRTIYENFKDKEDVLQTLLLKLKSERNKELEKFISDEYNVVEVFIKIIEIQNSLPIINNRFVQDIYKYYPRIAKNLQENMRKNTVFLQDFLKKGIEQGYVREDLNIAVTAFLVEESNYTYIRATYLEQPPFSFSELFYTMMINFVRGILTEKGIKIIDAYIDSKKQ